VGIKSNEAILHVFFLLLNNIFVVAAGPTRQLSLVKDLLAFSITSFLFSVFNQFGSPKNQLLMHMTRLFNSNLRMAWQYAIKLAMHRARTYH